jgi:uncharacterized protein (DUF1786 family)
VTGIVRATKKILAIDIGQGTQDILLYDPAQNIENCISLILPSPTAFYNKMIERCTQDLYIYGSTIGGGRITHALIQHINKGYHVYMDPEAAASVRDNLDRVKSLGIHIGNPPHDFNGMRLFIKEVDFPLLQQFLSNFAEDVDVEIIAVAVQDHGVSAEGKSDREFRFEVIAQRLRQDNTPAHCAYWADEVPPFFTRMTSLIKHLQKNFSERILVMDTAFCAVLGCIEEYNSPSVIVNVGNDHTLAVLIKDRKIEALFEHHTGMLTPEKLRHLITRFCQQHITSREVFNDGGHGVLYLNPGSVSYEQIIVTGPHREKMRLTGLPVIFAAPGGNMMLTGPLGLVRACQFKCAHQE